MGENNPKSLSAVECFGQHFFAGEFQNAARREAMCEPHDGYAGISEIITMMRPVPSLAGSNSWPR
jgi:hypothetical protein